MLTYNALVEQARLRGMPVTKPRGILREYLQVLILKEVYSSQEGRKLFFTGGTYLRLVRGLKRFSEDLDFNTDTLEKAAFERLLEQIVIGLKRLNIKARAQFDHWGNILRASLIFPEIEKGYNIVSQFSGKRGIVIKLEANRRKRKTLTESCVVTGFGEMYPCVCTDKGILFADKIDALWKKSRGRHLYDIIFMLSNKYPVEKKMLKSFGINADPLDAIEAKIRLLSATELKRQAEGLRPFLFDESEANLVTGAKTAIPDLVARYRIEK